LADLALLGPPFAAGLLVLATHVPLGREVLSRGIIFIDLAVAQIAALGVLIAAHVGFEVHGYAVQAVAAGSALLGAVCLRFTERRWPQVQEAIIGTVFVLAATGGLLLLAGNPRGGEHLADLLAGQVLWVSWSQLLPVAIATMVLLAAWHLLPRGRFVFYAVFALAVTVSVQLVGVYLVFASLIIPALATRGLPARRGLMFGYLVGAGGYALGLLLSARFDYPTGPLIVWALAVLALVSRGVMR
jgi:zinc/manganese transport system permease protein